MRATTGRLREAVTQWLRVERATKEQTLQLLEAVYGGVIDGSNYEGRRELDEDVVAVDSPWKLEPPTDYRAAGEREMEVEDSGCGCLLDTLEQIKGERPGGWMPQVVGEVFVMALYVPFGATPSNNRWAAAVRDGIVDYYRARGWK